MGNQVSNNSITVSKRTVRKEGGIVVLPLERWKRFERENSELRLALEAILSGEMALRKKETRPFREFLKSAFPQYAKNL